MVVVTRGRVHGHVGRDREQEARVVPWKSGDKLASTTPHSTVSHYSGEPGPGESKPLAAEPKAAGLPTAETVTSTEGTAGLLHHLKVRAAPRTQGGEAPADRICDARPPSAGRPPWSPRTARTPVGTPANCVFPPFFREPAPAAGEHEHQQSQPGVNPRGAGRRGREPPTARTAARRSPKALNGAQGRMPRSPPPTL